MRRRAVLLMVAMAAALVVGAGVALADDIECSITNPCVGTDNADYILGTEGNDKASALKGDDVVEILGGRDKVFGDEGNDSIDGYGGNDVIYGGPGGDGSAEAAPFIRLQGSEDSDIVYGGDGNDIIDAAVFDRPQETNTAVGTVDHSYGEAGDDTIYADDGPENKDLVYGGAGNDTIYALDGGEDTIDCGDGEDIVHFDVRSRGGDTVRNCESLNPPPTL